MSLSHIHRYLCSIRRQSSSIRIPLSMASTRNSLQYWRNIPMRAEISLGSLSLFSVEKANTVRVSIPYAMHHLENSIRVLEPSQCPRVALPYFTVPYLRFPSIMTATWRGTCCGATPLSLVDSFLLNSIRACLSRSSLGIVTEDVVGDDR